MVPARRARIPAWASVSTTVQAAQSITDTTGQADKLTGLAGQSFGCFLVNPISGTNLVQGMARIAAKGTPIVNIDSPVDASAAKAADAAPATYIGTDNTQAGELAGKHMAELLGGSGKVAVILGFLISLGVSKTKVENWTVKKEATTHLEAKADLDAGVNIRALLAAAALFAGIVAVWVAEVHGLWLIITLLFELGMIVALAFSVRRWWRKYRTARVAYDISQMSETRLQELRSRWDIERVPDWDRD